MQNTAYQLIGGEKLIVEMAKAFYRRVLSDPLMFPFFIAPDEDHGVRMAIWLIEEMGGPANHSRLRGGQADNAKRP